MHARRTLTITTSPAPCAFARFARLIPASFSCRSAAGVIALSLGRNFSLKVRDWELHCASPLALPDCSDPAPRPGAALPRRRPLSLTSDREGPVPNAQRKSAELTGALG